MVLWCCGTVVLWWSPGVFLRCSSVSELILPCLGLFWLYMVVVFRGVWCCGVVYGVLAYLHAVLLVILGCDQSCGVVQGVFSVLFWCCGVWGYKVFNCV